MKSKTICIEKKLADIMAVHELKKTNQDYKYGFCNNILLKSVYYSIPFKSITQNNN